MSENHPVFDIESDVFQDSPLATVYENVMSELEEQDGSGREHHHRVALWVAWKSHKTICTEEGENVLSLVGLPKTQKEFAELLGVSPRTVRRYGENYSDLARTAQNSAFNRLLGRYRLPALAALGESASNAGYQHASDRRTLFTLTGDLVDSVDVTSGGEKVQQVTYITENRPDDSDD